MITMRLAGERAHDSRRKQDSWQTFHQGRGSSARTFGPLEMLKEEYLAPSAGVLRHKHRGIELLTYVRAGALAYEDSMGRSGIINTGEFQCLTAGDGIHHSERNASPTEQARIFQMWLRPGTARLDLGHAQKRFTVAQRRGRLCIFASPDARDGSLRIHQDAFLYSALLHPGQHIVHELSPGRRAWLHVVDGMARLGETLLRSGDGVGLTDERAVSLTAVEQAEIILFDLSD